MPDIRCSAWHVYQTRPVYLICLVPRQKRALIIFPIYVFLFLLAFMLLSLVCGIVYMFVCKLYALLCWRKIKYLSISNIFHGFKGVRAIGVRLYLPLIAVAHVSDCEASVVINSVIILIKHVTIICGYSQIETHIYELDNNKTDHYGGRLSSF